MRLLQREVRASRRDHAGGTARSDCTAEQEPGNFGHPVPDAGAEAYLESDRKPSDYVDAFKAANNVKAVNTLTPKWDDAAGNEDKLGRIITQKWLAMFPEGGEAWAEQRRTGYPRLFPVLVNQSEGTVDTNLGPRRLNFFVGIKTTNPEQYTQLVNALGGIDNCGTRLWWDTGRNF